MEAALSDSRWEPIAPYHLYRAMSFDEAEGAQVTQSVTIDEVKFKIHISVVTFLLTVTTYGLIFADVTLLERLTKQALEDLDDFGTAGATIVEALRAFIPDASALSQHDIFLPFLTTREQFTYDHLKVKYDKQVHITNEKARTETDDVDAPDRKPPARNDLPDLGGATAYPLGPGPGAPSGGRPGLVRRSGRRLEPLRLPAAQRPSYLS